MSLCALSVAPSIAAQEADGQEVEDIDTPSLYPDPALEELYLPGPGETSFNFRLSGYVFGFKIVSASYNGRFSDDEYMVFTNLKTSGLGALLKSLRIWAVTRGTYDRSGLYPLTHTQQNIDKKSRRVEMQYDYDTERVSVDINPPIGSQGVPPASPSERFSADDVPTALLNILMRDTYLEGDVCTGTVRVFDSKQHYGLRLVRTGVDTDRFEGETYETLECDAYYEPISGFDPEDLPESEESGTPVKISFIKHESSGLYLPVRFSYKISGFGAVIRLKDVTIRKGQVP